MIRRLCNIIILHLIFITFLSSRSIVMFNPAGHKGNPGRPLDRGYERGVTYQIAESLQKKISERYDAQCLLTRSPGEEVLELQNASFANRANVDFFVSIHVYREESVKPKVALYYLMNNPMVDLAPHTFSNYSFLLLEQAHIKNIAKTQSIAGKMSDILSGEEFRKRIDFFAPRGIPFRPLRGIVAPAVAIEIGLKEEDKWTVLIDPLVESMRFLLSF